LFESWDEPFDELDESPEAFDESFDPFDEFESFELAESLPEPDPEPLCPEA
jgi:hypothetical protein